MFGYKNHVGIDRSHGFVRRFTVTHAAAHDGAQLARLLDVDNLASGVWADTAYRSKANLRLLDRRGHKPEFQRAKPRGQPMPAHIRQCDPRPGPRKGRARLRRPEAPPPSGRPDHRSGQSIRQDRTRQSRLQLHQTGLASRTARARLTARRCNADASKPAPQTLGERPPRRRTPSHYLNRAENDPLFEVSI